ncbi:hypothetical protein GCM10010317_104360 [Streptomyces mirabilis]|nr:hypothetical protein GCM10010317_104360 [Streptomyces mirabilis]
MGGLGGAVTGRLQHAGKVDVQVLDFDLAAARPKFSGKEFGESACPFPEYVAVGGVRNGPGVSSWRGADE